MRRRYPILLLVCVAMLLGGCFGGRMLAGDPSAGPAQAPAAPLYCYRNLARVDCYTGPDPQRRH